MPERYQKEIEEILHQVNEDGHEDSRSIPKLRPWEATQSQSMGTRRPKGYFRFTTGKVLLGGVVLLILSPLLAGLGLMAPVAWGGIILIIAAYIGYFRKPRRHVERMWRGQSIEEHTEATKLSSLWSWLTRG